MPRRVHSVRSRLSDVAKIIMPFLHLDVNNLHKEAWYELVKDHPLGFEVLEWNTEQNRDLVYREYPTLDTQLYPRSCVSILASMLKLVTYGGIAVRGEDVSPVRGLKALLKDWTSSSEYPEKLTVRGYGYPVYIDKTTIMAAKANDEVCKLYRDRLVDKMSKHMWEHPTFDNGDVAIM